MGSRKPLVLMFLLRESAHDGSSSRVFNMNPESSHRDSQRPRSFFGALPKTIPIPPSAPSRNHNEIGLQSSTTFP
ncbi:Protein IDA-LIKE 3 [Hibiscus syriacus]|uniref:Protein IDA-LIKE 3 n=1 Tax=Hibiscus syriacus TaxID=106335 RepID=A0A6A2Y715_HIBSY|nr:Protein IDA-LIKE 3 [Hibiscus syriacus]